MPPLNVLTHWNKLCNDPDISAIGLLTLTALCPGTEGAVVYQARALYNSVFNESLEYPVCSGSGARIANDYVEKVNSLKWKLDLYPNPAGSAISIASNVECKYLNVQICDLSGRLLLTKNLIPKGLITNLDLDLMNGAYLIQVKNDSNETLTKKLLIGR